MSLSRLADEIIGNWKGKCLDSAALALLARMRKMPAHTSQYITGPQAVVVRDLLINIKSTRSAYGVAVKAELSRILSTEAQVRHVRPEAAEGSGRLERGSRGRTVCSHAQTLGHSLNASTIDPDTFTTDRPDHGPIVEMPVTSLDADGTRNWTV